VVAGGNANMRIQITSADIAKRNEMSAEEWAKYIEQKMAERKSELFSWIAPGFDKAFGI
jgi:hypothetical protein